MKRIAAALPVTLMLILCSAFTSAQLITGGSCKAVSERTSEVGCCILANQPVGQFTQPQVFWHLAIFWTVATAETAKSARSTVVEAFGRVWLLTIEAPDWRPQGGELVSEVGPLSIGAGTYSAQYIEAVFTPGMTSAAHTHTGPEAWHTVAGEMCLETPDGKQIGQAGGAPVIVPEGPPMHLTATGTEIRKA
jgi:quercetin dioxygenase-like cupin family protein